MLRSDLLTQIVSRDGVVALLHIRVFLRVEHLCSELASDDFIWRPFDIKCGPLIPNPHRVLPAARFIRDIGWRGVHIEIQILFAPAEVESGFEASLNMSVTDNRPE